MGDLDRKFLDSKVLLAIIFCLTVGVFTLRKHLLMPLTVVFWRNTCLIETFAFAYFLGSCILSVFLSLRRDIYLLP